MGNQNVKRTTGYFEVQGQDCGQIGKDWGFLSQSNQLLQVVINNIPQSICWKDCNLVYLGCNKVFAQSAGFDSPEEIIGKTDFDFLGFPQADLNCADDRLVLDSGTPKLNYEELHTTPAGCQVWLRTNKIPLWDVGGNVVAILCTHENITERRNAEAERECLLTEVQQTKGLLHSVIDATPDWIFIKDQEHRYLMVNKGYADDLHLPPEDFIGKNDLDLGFPEEMVIGNPEKGIRGFWPDDRLVMDSGLMQVYSEDPAVIDGSIHTFHTIKSPLKNTHGQVWGVLAFARDITEITELQRKLLMVYDALDRIDTSIFISDSVGHFVYVNKKACQALQYSRDELLGMELANIDQSTGKVSDKEIYLGLETGKVGKMKQQTTYIGKSGYMFPVEVSSSTYSWRGIHYRISVVRDMSNQVQLDELLIRVEQDFMVLVEQSPDIIVRYHLDLHCFYVNQAWESILGFPQLDMLDKTPTQNTYLPEEVTRGMERILLQVMDSGHAVKQEFVLPHAKSKGLVYLLVDVLPERNSNGLISGVLVVARNISGLKRSEEVLMRKQAELEEAQRLGHSGSWEFDLVANHLEWSDEIFRIFEIDKVVFSATFEAFIVPIHPDDRETVNTTYWESVKNKTNYDIEYRLLFDDGRVKYVAEHGLTYYDSEGFALRSIGTVRDITEQKERERELLRTKERAEESSRLKSAFLAIVSHELRTPMNAILGFSSLMKDDSLAVDERNEFIDIIDVSVSKLIRLINEIIELSKIESGDIPIKIQQYSPFEILKQQQQELTELCQEVGKMQIGIKTEVNLAKDEMLFTSDTIRIKQVLHILIDNAVKFTKEGVIILGLHQPSDDQIVFRISDSGIGIPEDKFDSVFNPFVQVEGALSRKYEGLGIGLSAARKIARALGGDVTLVSELGKGSVVSFNIPREYKKRQVVN